MYLQQFGEYVDVVFVVVIGGGIDCGMIGGWGGVPLIGGGVVTLVVGVDG